MAYPKVIDDFKACITMERPSRVPVFALSFTYDFKLAGLTEGQARREVEEVVRSQVDAVKKFDYDWVLIFPDDYIEFEPLGLIMEHDDQLPAMPRDYLPLDRASLAGYRIPDPCKEMRLPIQLETIRRCREVFGNEVLIGGRIAGPFSALGLIYGISPLLLALLDDPDLVRDHLAFFIEHQIAYGQAQIEAGADLLWLGDNVSSSRFISPDHFRDIAAPAAAAVAEAMTQAGSTVIYFTSETRLPRLKMEAELPASALAVSEGVSIPELKKEIRGKKCLIGNLDPALLAHGTAEEVKTATEKAMMENAVGGGYVFNTGEGVMDNSPLENVLAMMKTAKALSAQAARL